MPLNKLSSRPRVEARVNLRPGSTFLNKWVPAFAGMVLVFFTISFSAHALISLKTVTVMVDPSMSTALVELARGYSTDSHVIVNTSFVSEQAQQEQINEGGAGDILITPSQDWIEELKTRGLVDVYSQTLVARNRLALVGPVSSPLAVKLTDGFPAAKLIMEFGGEQMFVVGNPETMMEGGYSKEALRNLGAAADLEPYTLYIKQPAAMFEMVTGYKGYGVFLYSTVIGRPDLRVLDVFPASSHRPIEYFGVVVAGENMDEARKFLDYVKSPKAKALLRDNGFSVD